MKKALVALVLLLLALPVGAEVIQVGASPVPHAEVLEFVQPILKEQGIDLRIRVFTDYVQPNLALSQGDLDANYFQHIPYLNSFSSDHGLNLEYTARVHIEPMGLYSRRLDSVESIPNRATVGIPNDPTNGGRALLLLESAGLIKLDPDAGLTATPFDVIENPYNLRFSELEAALLPRSLDDLHLAVINTNFALEAGFVPLEDALVIESPESPYVNILVIREGEETPALKALAEVLNTEEVREFILERYEGAVVPAF